MSELKLLSVKDFLQTYGISKTKFYDLKNTNKIEAKKVGNKTVIASKEAERWANSLPSAKIDNQDE